MKLILAAMLIALSFPVYALTPQDLCKLEDNWKKEWLPLKEAAEIVGNPIRSKEFETKAKEKENEIKTSLKNLFDGQMEALMAGFNVIVYNIFGSTTEGVEVTFNLSG